MSDSATPRSPGSSVHGILHARKRTYININRRYGDLFSSEFSKKKIFLMKPKVTWGLPRWLSGIKNPTANAGDAGLIPGSGRSSGEGNGNPLQHSCLENPMDRGAWWATVHRFAKESDTT